MTLGNRGNTHGFHEFYARFFAEQQVKNFNSYLAVVGSFTLHSPTLVNANKAMKSGTLLSQVACCTKPLKSTDMHCILATKINISLGESTTRGKKCQIFTSAMYSSYQASVSPEGDSKWDEPCDFSRSPLRAN